MSACVAAGLSRPYCQSVSVVPMIQRSPQGSTNRTLFSVGRMRAYSDSMRSWGTTTCTPFEGRTIMGDATPARRSISVVHTPVALITVPARTSNSPSDSRSATRTPAILSPSCRKPTTATAEAQTAPQAAAVRASTSEKRASSTWASK